MVQVRTETGFLLIFTILLRSVFIFKCSREFLRDNLQMIKSKHEINSKYTNF